MIVIHGEDHVASRQALNQHLHQAQQQQKEIISFQAKDLNLTQLKQSLESQSLFGNQRLIIIEDLLSKNDQKTKPLIKYIQTELPDNLMCWESKKLTASQLKPYPRTAITEFPLPQILFTFLDQLGTIAPAKSLQQYHQLQTHQAPELLFAMIAKRLRQLIIVTAPSQQIAQLDKLADWQIRKLKQQLRHLQTSHIKQLYQQMVDYDYKRKSGQTARQLDHQLQQWILTFSKPSIN